MYSLSMSPHPQLEQIFLYPGCHLFHVKRKQEVVGLYKSVKKERRMRRTTEKAGVNQQNLADLQ